MVETRSHLKKRSMSATKNQFSEKKSIPSLENLKVPSETSSETTSKSSSISHLYSLLNCFFNYFRCSRRNSENTANLLTSSHFNETESISSETEKNQIPQERNENISSESSSSKTNSFRRWTHSPVFKFSSIPFIGCTVIIGVPIVLYIDFRLYQSWGSTQLDIDPKGDSHLPAAVPSARPASFYEPKEVSDTSVRSVVYPVSPGEIQSIQAEKRVSDIFDYLMTQSEKIQGNTDKLSEMHSLIKQLKHRSDKNSENFSFTTRELFELIGKIILFGGLCGSLCVGLCVYRLRRQPDRSLSTADNDNAPRHTSPDDDNHQASYRTVRRQVSEFKLSDDELSCSSTGSASLSPRGVSQATNSSENFPPLTLTSY